MPPSVIASHSMRQSQIQLAAHTDQPYRFTCRAAYVWTRRLTARTRAGSAGLLQAPARGLQFLPQGALDIDHGLLGGHGRRADPTSWTPPGRQRYRSACADRHLNRDAVTRPERLRTARGLSSRRDPPDSASGRPLRPAPRRRDRRATKSRSSTRRTGPWSPLPAPLPG